MPNRMEEIASKGMGKIKKAKAAITGLEGVFRTLAEQHGEVSVLLKRCNATSSPDRRGELWPEIRCELLSHERAEMSELYAILRKDPQTRELADHHDVEAAEMESMIEQLDDEDIATDQWGELFAQLADSVQAHAEEEENEIFPQAQLALGEEKTMTLDQRFLSVKERIADELAGDVSMR